jgi:hypothetical protein
MKFSRAQPKTREQAIRQMLRAETTRVNRTNNYGVAKTGKAGKPRPITLPKLAFLGDTVTESGPSAGNKPS